MRHGDELEVPLGQVDRGEVGVVVADRVLERLREAPLLRDPPADLRVVDAEDLALGEGVGARLVADPPEDPDVLRARLLVEDDLPDVVEQPGDVGLVGEVE